MAEAAALSKLHSVAEVERALGTAVVTGRFADKGLLSIVDYQATREHTEPVRRSEEPSLQPGTSAWASFGLPTQPASDVYEYDESDLA